MNKFPSDLIAFIGKRVATLSHDKMNGRDRDLLLIGRHLEANLIFREAQRLRKIDAKRRKKKQAAKREKTAHPEG